MTSKKFFQRLTMHIKFGFNIPFVINFKFLLLLILHIQISFKHCIVRVGCLLHPDLSHFTAGQNSVIWNQDCLLIPHCFTCNGVLYLQIDCFSMFFYYSFSAYYIFAFFELVGKCFHFCFCSSYDFLFLSYNKLWSLVKFYLDFLTKITLFLDYQILKLLIKLFLAE